MHYTDEKIERYLNILKKQLSSSGDLGKDTLPDRHVRCWNCHSNRFFVNSGYNICEKCYVSNGQALGFYDHKEYDRFHFRKKSIYRSEEVSL